MIYCIFPGWHSTVCRSGFLGNSPPVSTNLAVANIKLSRYQKPTLSKAWHHKITWIPVHDHKGRWEQWHLVLYKDPVLTGKCWNQPQPHHKADFRPSEFYHHLLMLLEALGYKKPTRFPHMITDLSCLGALAYAPGSRCPSPWFWLNLFLDTWWEAHLFTHLLSGWTCESHV